MKKIMLILTIVALVVILQPINTKAILMDKIATKLEKYLKETFDNVIVSNDLDELLVDITNNGVSEEITFEKTNDLLSTNFKEGDTNTLLTIIALIEAISEETGKDIDIAPENSMDFLSTATMEENGFELEVEDTGEIDDAKLTFNIDPNKFNVIPDTPTKDDDITPPTDDKEDDTETQEPVTSPTEDNKIPSEEVPQTGSIFPFISLGIIGILTFGAYTLIKRKSSLYKL